MSASLIHKQTKSKATEFAEPAQVGAVVQEYMDSLLVDLFPEISVPVEDIPAEAALKTEPIAQAQVEEIVEVPDIQAVPELKIEHEVITQTEIETHSTVKTETVVKTKLNLSDPLTQVLVQVAQLIQTRKNKIEVKSVAQPELESKKSVSNKSVANTQINVKEAPIDKSTDLTLDAKTDVTIEALSDVPEVQVKGNTQTDIQDQVQAAQLEKAEPLKYPNAPAWAQEAFDVLLFDICGLKLAVPMESLGRIIKMNHETNQLIGRPDWFLGAYTDADQHFYAVDTAQYIMPEQKIDLVKEGFGFLIQLQKTQWTLACQHVHSTVRLEPGDVKWRSQKGWFAGTLVEHMCALLHVDSLVDTLEADSH